MMVAFYPLVGLLVALGTLPILSLVCLGGLIGLAKVWKPFSRPKPDATAGASRSGRSGSPRWPSYTPAEPADCWCWECSSARSSASEPWTVGAPESIAHGSVAAEEACFRLRALIRCRFRAAPASIVGRCASRGSGHLGVDGGGSRRGHAGA